MTSLIILLLLLMLVIGMGLIALAIFAPRTGQKPTKTKKFRKINQTHRRYSNSFWTRKQYQKIVEAISQLSIYSFQEVREKAIMLFRMSEGMMWGMWLIGTTLSRDPVISLLIFLFTRMLRNVFIDRNIEKYKTQLLHQLDDTLSSLREEYVRLNSIPDAISECRKGPLIESLMDDIYEICTSIDGAEKLNGFFVKCKFRQVATLAQICYILNDMGDSKTAKGESTFQADLTIIKDEVDQEIEKKHLIKLKFNGLEWIPLVPLIAIYPLQNVLLQNIPGLSVIYYGPIGYISRLSIVIGAYIVYYIITNLNSDSYIRNNDRLEYIDWLLKFKWFKQFCVNFQDKTLKSKVINEKRLNNSLTQKDMVYIMGEKIIFSSITFVLALIVSIIMVISTRQYIWNNAGSMSIVAGNEHTPEEYQKLLAYDKEVLNMDTLPDAATLSQEVKRIKPKIDEISLQDEVSRIQMKYNLWKKSVYHWWYVLVCYFIAIITWFVPDLILAFRAYIIKSRAEEDVLQMQTVIAALMDTPLDTLDILYWLEKNSVIHKDVLRYCYHEYTNDADKALTRLKHQSTLVEFTRIVDKLMSTISQITVAEAFSDLGADRAHVMKMKEMNMRAQIDKKRAIASPLALTPAVMLAVGMMLIPIGILAMTELSRALAYSNV